MRKILGIFMAVLLLTMAVSVVSCKKQEKAESEAQLEAKLEVANTVIGMIDKLYVLGKTFERNIDVFSEEEKIEVKSNLLLTIELLDRILDFKKTDYPFNKAIKNIKLIQRCIDSIEKLLKAKNLRPIARTRYFDGGTI